MRSAPFALNQFLQALSSSKARGSKRPLLARFGRFFPFIARSGSPENSRLFWHPRRIVRVSSAYSSVFPRKRPDFSVFFF